MCKGKVLSYAHEDQCKRDAKECQCCCAPTCKAGGNFIFLTNNFNSNIYNTILKSIILMLGLSQLTFGKVMFGKKFTPHCSNVCSFVLIGTTNCLTLQPLYSIGSTPTFKVRCQKLVWNFSGIVLCQSYSEVINIVNTSNIYSEIITIVNTSNIYSEKETIVKWQHFDISVFRVRWKAGRRWPRCRRSRGSLIAG